MKNATDYQRQMLAVIGSLGGERPKLLLHACCAPCATACLERLKDAFALTAYYYNPNISPIEEYQKRAEELQRIWDDVIVEPYDSAPFYALARGKETAAEGGVRCEACFRLRLERTAQAAKQAGIEWISTTLTVSPHKNARLLNEIGQAAAQKYGVRWLPCDFKKASGYARSVQLSREYGLYRQNWCGCEFSRRAATAGQEEQE